MIRSTLPILVLILLPACAPEQSAQPELVGRFNPAQDLYLAHFDCRTDVDDLHSVAGVATMLADPRFVDVRYHAVAGAYGIQEGLYVPANELFDLAFGDRWSDAHADREQALEEVAPLATTTLREGGSVWIAEAGQSDFSAALVRRLQTELRGDFDRSRIHIVQHADWNEEVTSPDALAFVKEEATYHRIPDGNTVGNGTPGFRSETPVDWQPHVRDVRLTEIWETAIRLGDTYNGIEGRYLNAAIKGGGIDFSDVSETAWIFGFGDLVDASDFFEEFGVN